LFENDALGDRFRPSPHWFFSSSEFCQLTDNLSGFGVSNVQPSRFLPGSEFIVASPICKTWNKPESFEGWRDAGAILNSLKIYD
jgi:hypothetical protein